MSRNWDAEFNALIAEWEEIWPQYLKITGKRDSAFAGAVRGRGVGPEMDLLKQCEDAERRVQENKAAREKLMADWRAANR